MAPGWTQRGLPIAREVEFLNVLGVAHHGKDHVGPAHGLGRALGPRGAALNKAWALEAVRL